MKKYVIYGILFIFPLLNASAFFDGATANVGLGWRSEGVSDETGFNGAELLELQPGPVLTGEFELPLFLGFSFTLGANIGFGNARAQYDRQNSVTLVPVQIRDLKAKAWQFLGRAGGRMRAAIFYAGGGVVAGQLNITYDNEVMTDKLIDLAGVKTDDSASLSGFYVEAGMEFKTSFLGIRVFGNYMSLKTGQLETLSNKKSTYGVGMGGFEFLFPFK